MAGTVFDAARSIQKYTSDVLGEEWEVALAEEEGQFAVPSAFVVLVGDLLVAGPAWYADFTQPFAIHVYPEPGNLRMESIARAEAVREQLVRAFRLESRGARGVDGAPMRVPFYDFDGVALHETTENRRFLNDMLGLVDFNCNRMLDSENPLNVGLIATFRATWRRTGAVPSGTKVVESGKLTLDVTGTLGG